MATPTTRERVAHLVEQGLSVREVAAILNVSTQAVYKHLKALDVPPPSQSKAERGAA